MTDKGPVSTANTRWVGKPDAETLRQEAENASGDDVVECLAENILAYADAWEADEARVEAARLLAFQMQQCAAAIQSDPDKANAVSAAWVIDIAGRLLAALAAGEVKP